MNLLMGFGNLSTRKAIDPLRHGLERCIVCLVRMYEKLEHKKEKELRFLRLN